MSAYLSSALKRIAPQFGKNWITRRNVGTLIKNDDQGDYTEGYLSAYSTIWEFFTQSVDKSSNCKKSAKELYDFLASNQPVKRAKVNKEDIEDNTTTPSGNSAKARAPVVFEVHWEALSKVYTDIYDSISSLANKRKPKVMMIFELEGICARFERDMIHEWQINRVAFLKYPTCINKGIPQRAQL